MPGLSLSLSYGSPDAEPPPGATRILSEPAQHRGDERLIAPDSSAEPKVRTPRRSTAPDRLKGTAMGAGIEERTELLEGVDRKTEQMLSGQVAHSG